MLQYSTLGGESFNTNNEVKEELKVGLERLMSFLIKSQLEIKQNLYNNEENVKQLFVKNEKTF